AVPGLRVLLGVIPGRPYLPQDGVMVGCLIDCAIPVNIVMGAVPAGINFIVLSNNAQVMHRNILLSVAPLRDVFTAGSRYINNIWHITPPPLFCTWCDPRSLLIFPSPRLPPNKLKT